MESVSTLRSKNWTSPRSSKRARSPRAMPTVGEQASVDLGRIKEETLGRTTAQPDFTQLSARHVATIVPDDAHFR